MSLGDAETLVKDLQGAWGTYKGLLLAALVCFLISLTGSSWPDRAAIFAIIFTGTAIAWSHARWQWWGRWRRQKIRFLVGVYCDDPAMEPQIEEDFTRELRILIKDGNLGHDVMLVEATRAECRATEGDRDLRDLMRRKKAHVFVYGRVKRRETDQGQALYLALRAAVAHAALESKLQQNFAAEITSVFPTGLLKIPVNEQLPQLKLTAEWVGVSTRYILSLAAGISGDLDYAEKMLSDAVRLTPRLSTEVAKRTKLRERLLNRLLELHRAQAMRAFVGWRKSRDPALAERVKVYAQLALQRAPGDSPIKQLLATTNFVLTGDAITAEKELRAAMFDHAAVFASLAFALAMQGKYSAARRAYRDTWKRKPDPDLIEQVETFCDWFKVVYPDFANQVTWCEVQVAAYTKVEYRALNRKIDYLLRAGGLDESERNALRKQVSGEAGSGPLP